jgi:CHRD domain
MRKLVLAVGLVAAASLTVVAAVAIAHGGNGGIRGHLNGYQETTGPGSISTTGRGRVELRIRDDGIHYRLRYSNIDGGAVTQAHIHFAQRHVAGGIIAFLCGGSEAACTSPNGDISGVITTAEILGPNAQGIEPGSMAEAVRAIRVGATYANVHTTRWPQGEIRGQLLKRGRGHDKDD